jgi:hypothetical protein
MLSYEDNNLLPIEEDLPIVRSAPPQKFAILDPDVAKLDPFTKLATDQIAVYNNSIKGTKIAPNKDPKQKATGQKPGKPRSSSSPAPGKRKKQGG